jgi:hypothetical protein
MPLIKNFTVSSPDVKYTDEEIIADYNYHTTKVEVSGDAPKVIPVTRKYTFKTERKVPKMGYVFFLYYKSSPSVTKSRNTRILPQSFPVVL